MSGEEAFRDGMGSTWLAGQRIYHLTPRAHRADIDGLRAVAVLSVMLYHYLPHGFPGGFVGVDVFFVISGYLITDHIATELTADRFSLLSFYEKRIRRIFPALMLMIALVTVASALILFPPELRYQSRLAARVPALIGNFAYFYGGGRYGGEFAARAPLLHTWSLAIEEQFYAVFPLLMLAIRRFGSGRYAAVLWPLALISLAACLISVRVAPMAAFYLPHARAWELLAGAILAVGGFSPPASRRVRAGWLFVGLSSIVGSDLLLNIAMPYPSEITLLPCLGAVAIIYAASDKSVPLGGLLDNPVMRRIGLWSYSMYLIHWPLLVLAQYYALDPLSLAARGTLLAVTVMLAALSWRYVEQPFRGPNALLRRPVLFAGAAAASATLLCASLAIFYSANPTRYTPEERRFFTSETPSQRRCQNTSPAEHAPPPCQLGEPGAPVDTLFWGDSHALAMLPVIESAYTKHHQAVMIAQHGGCPALPGVYIRTSFPAQSPLLHAWADSLGSGRAVHCKKNTDAVLDWVLRKRIHTVILCAHWMAYIGNQDSQRLTDSHNPVNATQSENPVIFARGFEQLLDALERAQVKVYVLDDSPKNLFDIPYALASARRLGLNRDFGLTRLQYDTQQQPAIDIFSQLQKRHRFQTLKPEDFLCAGGHCAIQQGDQPLYVDQEHLSATGALITEPALAPIWQDGH